MSPSFPIRTVRPDNRHSGMALPRVSVMNGAAICAASKLGNLRWYVLDNMGPCHFCASGVENDGGGGNVRGSKV